MRRTFHIFSQPRSPRPATTPMNNRCKKGVSCVSTMVPLFLAAFIGANVRAQMIDLNANGMSDVWEQIYGASGLDPNADTDGDGVINRLEAIAGTDPLDPSSAPIITGTAFLGTNVIVTMPC